ncbi:Threonine/homoserine efflux transporter RhtA [Amphritea atlantica]|uniref:Threonine/homoserine efflux transporter RhtA n=1 Tax=Amphritea atlantica TaxID=355243 RepID=A0A1H9HW85_9GAMM|nr:DMT family transporter [Amphritea atlantica]SEQ66485.1 Threonine/homoserine efflux transporter RhtA [Amphritea atlantica]
METRNIRADLTLLLVAAIWGLAFVAQRLGMDHLGPFGFNGCRFLLGAVSLLPLLLIFRPKAGATEPRAMLRGGITAGMILFLGASLQQAGLLWTTAGNAGFITGLYIIIVPLLGLLLGHITRLNTWLGGLLAVVGLYFLTIETDSDASFTINSGDLLVLGSALFWAAHVVVIGRLASQLDNLRLAIIQFFVCALLSFIVALVFEQDSLTLSNITLAWQPIAYAGLLSVGVAYTLQVVAQRHAPASHAAIIMSLEAVFAAIGGWWLLEEAFSNRALIGCTLMLAGMIVSQLNLFRRKQLIATNG